MALLNSEKIQIGSSASDFNLASVEGKKVPLSDFRNKKVLVIIFMCNHCPYVKAIEDRIIQLERDNSAKGVQLIGICSNDPTDYPDDKPESLLQRWKEKDYRFPYLIDETQEIAKAYGAVCTPDLYVYDQNRKLAYHGRLDDNWKEPQKVKSRDLQKAIDQLLLAEAPSASQQSSMGCSIKWKKA